MNDDANKKIILKFLSGPHFGAQVFIKDGEYIIGKNKNCDIIIQDCTVSSRHMVLRVNRTNEHEQIFTVKALNAGIWYQDQEITNKNDEIALEPGESIIGLGTTQLVLGYLDQDWSKIVLPYSQLHTSPRRISENIDDVDENSSNENLPETISKSPVDCNIHTPIINKIRKLNIKSKYNLLVSLLVNKYKNVHHKSLMFCKSLYSFLPLKKITLISLATILLFIVSSLSPAFLVSSQVETDNRSLTSSLQFIKLIIDSDEYQHLNAESVKNEFIRISGFVPEAHNFVKLRKKITEIESPIKFDVTVGSEIVEAVRTVIDVKKINGKVKYLGKGRVELGLYGNDYLEIMKMENDLKIELPHINYLNIRRYLIKNADNKIKNADNNTIKSFPKKVNVAKLVETDSIKNIFFNKKIQSISLTDKYILAEDGSHFFIGSILENGYILKEISADSITITSKTGTIKSIKWSQS